MKGKIGIPVLWGNWNKSCWPINFQDQRLNYNKNVFKGRELKYLLRFYLCKYWEVDMKFSSAFAARGYTNHITKRRSTCTATFIYILVHKYR